MPEIKYGDLSAAHRRQVDALKRDVSAFAGKFQIVQESRADLAPKFMRLYSTLDADYGLTFVDYVRMFDPSVPTQAGGENGYRLHKTYAAADYLRRLVRQRPRGRQGIRDNATDSLARLIATLLQIAPQPESVWKACQTEFNFSERQMSGLRRRVDSTKPVFALSVPRGARVQVGNVIHMERQTPEAPAPAAQPQARRTRAA